MLMLKRQRLPVIADCEQHAVERACIQAIRVARQALQRRRGDTRETWVCARAQRSEMRDEPPELVPRLSASNREWLTLLIP